MRSMIARAAAAAAFLASSLPALANPIANGDFETPVTQHAGFTTYNSGSSLLTGWSVVGSTGTQVAIVDTNFFQSGVTFEAESGNQWLDMTGLSANSNEGIEQNVTTIAGHKYALTFWVGNTTGGGIFGTDSTVALSVNDTSVGTFTNAVPDATALNWQQFTYNFTATGNSTLFEFDNADPSNDNSNGLDNIVLTDMGTGNPPPPPGVPEPATLALFGLGLLGAMRRKKQSRRFL